MIKDVDVPPTIHLKDYQAPPYLVETLALRFELVPERTVVTSTAEYVRNGESTTLVLDGEHIELLEVRIDERVLSDADYIVDESTLTLKDLPERFTLTLKGAIDPKGNTTLSGLYVSRNMFCTQCEAQGFRRITYYQDRPDVMTKFTTTITADKAQYPVLLSNGNLVSTSTEGDTHTAVWEDPFAKPAYLFALVAGELANKEDTFTTKSGRDVTLRIFCRDEDIHKTDHAMVSLKKSMKWDEDVYGLEYDLDIFMIVAVSDFNFGAMENKGLNIFNTRYVLAQAETATDHDFGGIEGVVGHEYFHNWSGNRVTCRDWFQLSLKEGLTVFRDQEFSSDMGSRAAQRIADVSRLRSAQFPEDAGPTAHPIRPEAYVEINNFYTATVYEKGAEVVRMIQTLLGDEAFKKGVALYFKRHDGQAVTCDDFVQALQDSSGRDLTTFKRWYSQAGTPVVSVQSQYDAAQKSLTLKVRQNTEPTPGQPIKQALVIPLRSAILDDNGAKQAATFEGAPLDVLVLDQDEQSFVINNVERSPVLSLARGFSAPIKLHLEEPDAHKRVRMAHDDDAFNRYEAAQVLSRQVILDLAEGKATSVSQEYLQACKTLLSDDKTDPALIAEALTLPSLVVLAAYVDEFKPQVLQDARAQVTKAFAAFAKDELEARYKECTDTGAYQFTPEACGKRALRNRALAILSSSDGGTCAKEHYRNSTNMTDSVAALKALGECEDTVKAEAFASFYDRFKGDALVIDKWFGLQAISTRKDTPEKVKALLMHEDFDLKNPNRVRALMGNFASNNQVAFHREDGAGYVLLADLVAELDGMNPAVAARLLIPLTRHQGLNAERQKMMKAQLSRFTDAAKTSRDVFEIAGKGLA